MAALTELRLPHEEEPSWYALDRVVDRPLGCAGCHRRIKAGEPHARGEDDGRRLCGSCIAGAWPGRTMSANEANRRQRQRRREHAERLGERMVRMLLDGLEVGSISELKQLVDDARALRVELERQHEIWTVQSKIIRALQEEVSDEARARILAPLFPTTEGD